MSKSRRKSNGCTRGRYKPKKMGKGWLKDHQPKKKIAPRKDPEESSGSESNSDS